MGFEFEISYLGVLRGLDFETPYQGVLRLSTKYAYEHPTLAKLCFSERLKAAQKNLLQIPSSLSCPQMSLDQSILSML